MPVLSVPHSPPDGARVQLSVTLSRAELLRRRVARQPIPQPVVVVALIDTGAERCCIDPGVAFRAGLPFRAAGLTNAPGVGAGPPVLGGAVLTASYEAGIAVVHPSGNARDDFVVPHLIIDTLPLSAFGIEAVIGRDVLAACVLVYNGPTGSATLAY